MRAAPPVCPRLHAGLASNVRSTDQVVGGRGEGHDPIDQFAATVPQLAQPADGLHPAEDLLNQFPFALTDGVARMTGRAPVDARAGVLLRDMRSNPELARR